MIESLVNWFINIFGGLSKEFIIFIISTIPILELRGGLIAAYILDVNLIKAIFFCILGNMLPVPFILWFIEKFLTWCRGSKKFKFFANYLDKKVNRNKDKIEKYGFLGITLFVGIPLPMTGAWTGSLIAAMLKMDKKKAFFSAFLGVMMASIIVSLLSYGLWDILFG